MRVGGIDLGGTKVEARLFDARKGWSLLDRRSTPICKGSYAALLDQLGALVQWLESEGATLLGVGVPGLIGRDGRMLSANLSVSGHRLPGDLAARATRPLFAINDCRAFTLSEAVIGAGRDADRVVGLIMGTGLAGGFALNKVCVDGPNGQAGEFGHLTIPARPQWAALAGFPCGCGRVGCFETLCSGRGLQRLAAFLGMADQRPESLGRALLRDDPIAVKVMDLWCELLAELLRMLTILYDPQIIVLGGGLSNLPDVDSRLAAALAKEVFAGTEPPEIVRAEGGDRSGARGSALYALQSADGAAEED